MADDNKDEGKVGSEVKEKVYADVKVNAAIGALLTADAVGYARDMQAVVDEAIAVKGDVNEAVAKWNRARVIAGFIKEDAAALALKEKVAASTKAIDGVKAIMLDTMTAALTDEFKAAVEDIPREALTRLSFVLFRDEKSGKLSAPQVMAGEVVKVKKPKVEGESNGSRGEPLTVDGTEYPSAAAAKEALLPDKATAQMSRKAVVTALKSAGKTVTE